MGNVERWNSPSEQVVKAPQGQQKYNSILSLTSALGVGGGCMANATPRPLNPRESDLALIVQDSGWTRGPVWRVQKFSTASEFGLWIIAILLLHIWGFMDCYRTSFTFNFTFFFILFVGFLAETVVPWPTVNIKTSSVKFLKLPLSFYEFVARGHAECRRLYSQTCLIRNYIIQIRE